MTNNGTIKIADFGLAKLYKNNGCKNTLNVVTACYRAPEIILEY